MSANIREAVPFLMVADMQASLRFYVDGLGFTKTREWNPEGKVLWCRLEVGNAAIMLQESRQEETSSSGVSISFQCDDAVSLYRESVGRGLRTRQRPFVGNGLWVVPFTDPDGYRIDFESPTDAPEESELEGE